MKTIDRKVLLQALTGSHNYNLATEGSDKDYKVFTLPTFEDLYDGKFYKKNIITDTVDKDIKDIRQLPSLLYKSNIAYLELLFSEDVEYFNSSLRELFHLKDEIAKINLSQLFKSTGGLYKERLKRIHKSTEGTQHLVDKYGFNTKEAMHTFRSIDLLIKFEKKGFKDFGGCMRYDGEQKEFALNIRNGVYSKETFMDFITTYHDNYFAPLKEKYCSHEPNKELKEHLEFTIRHVVGYEMEEQLFLQY